MQNHAKLPESVYAYMLMLVFGNLVYHSLNNIKQLLKLYESVND